MYSYANSRIILITGANSGVGYAISKVITSASPLHHVILATRSRENGESAIENIRATGNVKGTLSTVQLDVTDSESILAATKYVAGRFGRLDVLVNNAGVSSKDPDLQTQLRKTLSVNLLGPAMLTEAMEPLLISSKKPYLLHLGSRYGSVTLISDPLSSIYNSPLLSYSASKAALNVMMVEHSKKLGPKGVKVFAVCPGFVCSNIRGKKQEQINGHGRAGDPLVSGQLVLDIIQGKRDHDVGRCIHKDGIYPW